jgi:hypothetical protein
MSSNKGKDGEMNALISFATVAKNEDNFDFTRATTTNTPDMGADIVLEHKKGFIENKMIPISQGKKVKTTIVKEQVNEKTRIDIKTTLKKISKDTVIKFIGDTRKNPDCKNHMIIGGSDISLPAKNLLIQTNKDLKKDNKKLYYVNNKEMKTFTDYYAEIENKENKKLEK